MRAGETLVREMLRMEKLSPEAIAAIVRRMTEESARRACKLAALREAIAAGVYRIRAGRLADAVVRTMKG